MPRERKGASAPKSNIREPFRYFVIASEGADTERIYFEQLKITLEKEDLMDKRIRIEYLERVTEQERTESSHKSVIAQLDKYRKTYHLQQNDELWLVIDRDKQNNPIKNISNIATTCQQKGYFLALSNPNFELWLLLHVKDLSDYSEVQQQNLFENRKVNSTKRFIEWELAQCLDGYDKSNYDVNKLLSHVEKAIRQAQQLDLNREDRWIEGRLGTRVYQLVERLTAS
jgi:RloB-like protein